MENNANSQSTPLTQNTAPAQNQQFAQYPSDEIDLVELLAMAWRLRNATVAGAAVGLLGGLVFVGMRSPTYETTVPVTISQQSLPANTDTKKVIEMYTSALGSPDVAAAAFAAMAQTAPELEASMKAQNVSLNDLVRTQTSLDTVGKPNKALLKVVASASTTDFYVTAKLPVKGMGEKARDAVVMAFNAAGIGYNSREAQSFASQTQGSLTEANKNVNAVMGKLEASMVAAFSTQGKVKSELAEIEYSLQRAAGADGANFARLLQPSPITVVVQNAGGTETKTALDGGSGAARSTVTAADFERVMRLKAVLVHDKRLAEKESAELDSRIARLQMKSQRMRAELEPLVASMESGRELIAKAQRAAMNPIERTTAFVPLFAFDSVMNSAEAKLAKVEQTGGKTLPVAGGTFLGAMVGFFGMALFKFVRKNQKRIAELVAKE